MVLKLLKIVFLAAETLERWISKSNIDLILLEIVLAVDHPFDISTMDGGMDVGMDGRKKIVNKEVKPDGMVTVSGQKRKIYCNLLLLLI